MAKPVAPAARVSMNSRLVTTMSLHQTRKVEELFVLDLRASETYPVPWVDGWKTGSGRRKDSWIGVGLNASLRRDNLSAWCNSSLQRGSARILIHSTEYVKKHSKVDFR